MVETNALEVFIAVLAMAQACLAYLLTRGGGWRVPLRGLAALLFLLNALVTLFVLLFAWTGFPQFDVATNIVDVPTNFLLLLVAWALYLPGAATRPGWPRPLLAALVAVAILAALHAVAKIYAATAIHSPLGDLVRQQLPLYTAYTLILVAGVRFFCRLAPDSERVAAGLIFAALVARPVQFGFHTGTLFLEPATWTGPWAAVNGSSHLALLAAALLTLALVAAWTLRATDPSDRRTGTWVLSALVGAAGIGLILRFRETSPAYTAIQLLTLVAVRPILLGLAYEPRSTSLLLGSLAAFTTAVILLKSLIAGAVGVSLWTLSEWDLAALALALLFVPVGAKVYRRLEQSLAQPFQPAKGAERPTRAERVHAVLLQAYQSGLGGWLTSVELAARSEVGESNLGVVVSALRRRLAARERSAAPREFLEIRVSHEGRQVRTYRLTPRGADAGPPPRGPS